ncbi:MAG: hypothetical protein HUU15_03905 [Candidatus Brocadiae bacterium]|nr:hypothetical protein [Candidatus Brocadiia bacterium]
MPADLAAFFTRLAADPEAAAKGRQAGVVLQFRLLEPSSFVVIDLTAEPFGVGTEEHGSPDVEITLSWATADRILRGEISVGDAARTHAAQARGGFLKLLALQGFLEVAKARYGAR